VTNNVLNPGDRRIGFLYDGQPETPKLHALLERSRDGEVTLSVICGREDQAHRWWTGGSTRYHDDLDRTRFRYSAPPHLVFEDHLGTVSLLGCEATRFAGTAFGEGVGTIKARYVVLGRTDTERRGAVRDLRAEISGLPEWVGYRPFTASVERDDSGLVQTTTVTAPRVDPVPLGEQDGATRELSPHWSSKVGLIAVLTSRLYAQSLTPTLRTWSAALDLPRGVRDLLALSQWRREEITSVEARFLTVPADADPMVRHRWSQWYQVISEGDADESRVGASNPSHLIEYADIGPEGLVAWLDLRTQFARALDPIVSMLFMKGATVETLMAQVGIGLEALGFLIATLDDGRSKSDANTSFVTRLERVRQDVGDAIPLDLADWPSRAAAAYASTKHANRGRRDMLEVAEAWQLSTLVARVWVAVRLGVSVEQLRDRVAHDHQSGGMTSVPDPADL